MVCLWGNPILLGTKGYTCRIQISATMECITKPVLIFLSPNSMTSLSLSLKFTMITTKCHRDIYSLHYHQLNWLLPLDQVQVAICSSSCFTEQLLLGICKPTEGFHVLVDGREVSCVHYSRGFVAETQRWHSKPFCACTPENSDCFSMNDGVFIYKRYSFINGS